MRSFAIFINLTMHFKMFQSVSVASIISESKQRTNKNMTTSAIKDAILRSIAHTEIVSAHPTLTTIEAVMSDVSEHSDDADYTQENDESWDIWGSRDGKEFRIRVHLDDSENVTAKIKAAE